MTSENQGLQIEGIINNLLKYHNVPAKVSVAMGIGMNLAVEVAEGVQADSEWEAAVNQMVMKTVSGVLQKENLEPERFPWISWKPLRRLGGF